MNYSVCFIYNRLSTIQTKMIVGFVILYLCMLVKTFDIVNSTYNQPKQQARIKRQFSNGFEFVDCVLPPHPENGQWRIISGSGSPGSTILPNTLIKFSCNPGFSLEPKKEFFICNTEWNPEKMPRCIANLCPPLSSSPSTSVRCFDGTGKTTPCNTVFYGNTATIKCAKFYEIPKGQESILRCLDGKWSASAVCEPICGKASETNDTELKSLTDVNLNEIPKYPWVATIFLVEDAKHLYICSGSLITASHVLSAAHCVTDYDGSAKLANTYQVAAGKIYSEYGDPRDLTAQYVEVERIIAHPSFRGEILRYKYDIALIQTKRPFRLNSLVQPVCFKGLNKIVLNDGDEGVFSLWGLDANHKISESVRYFKTKKSDKKCSEGLSYKFAAEYLTDDKVCALFQQDDQSLCTGYSGSGWMFKNPNDNRFYVRGIISVAEINQNDENRCVKPVTLCTNTSSYYDFIIKNVADS